MLARGRGRRSAFGRTTLRRVESFTDGARVVCRAATVGESPYLEHPHGAVERDRHDIARPHRLARRVDALAVDPHVTGSGERGSRRARPHHPRVPEPFIDALAVQGSTSATLRAGPREGVRRRSGNLFAGGARQHHRLAGLLGVRLELLLQRRKLGERGIRIRFAIAAVPALAPPFDVFRPQRWVTVWTVTTWRRPTAATLPAFLLWAARALGTHTTVGTLIRTRLALRALGSLGVGRARAMPAAVTALVGCGPGVSGRRRRRALGNRRNGNSIGRRRR